jgi:hypothetical protein
MNHYKKHTRLRQQFARQEATVRKQNATLIELGGKKRREKRAVALATTLFYVDWIAPATWRQRDSL